MYITEANIFKNDPDHALQIDGYNLELPLTWKNNKLEYARIALLIKNELNYEILKSIHGRGYFINVGQTKQERQEKNL